VRSPLQKLTLKDNPLSTNEFHRPNINILLSIYEYSSFIFFLISFVSFVYSSLIRLCNHIVKPSRIYLGVSTLYLKLRRE